MATTTTIIPQDLKAIRRLVHKAMKDAGFARIKRGRNTRLGTARIEGDYDLDWRTEYVRSAGRMVLRATGIEVQPRIGIDRDEVADLLEAAGLDVDRTAGIVVTGLAK